MSPVRPLLLSGLCDGNGRVAVMPFCTIVPIGGGKRLLGLSNIRRRGEKVEKRSNILAQRLSADGGLTWSPWRIVLDSAGAETDRLARTLPR